jgi:predicted dehydrogenase
MSPTPQQPLRIAVVGGSGLIGKRHCQHVSSNPSTTLIAIVDPSPSALETATLHSTTLYPSVAALLDASPDRPDAAIVCTPNHTHVPISSQLAEAGIHILCEKPISTDVQTAASLIATARKHNIRLLIGHHRRFNPYMLTTKHLLSTGAVGAITAVSGLWTVLKPASYFADLQAWRGKKSGGGGPVLLNFIHEIDLMHYLFGPVTRIHAEKTLSRRPQDADSAEEGAAVTMRFASGVVGTFVLSDNVASPHSFEGGTGENPVLAKTGADVYRIFGTEGTLSVPDMVLSTYEDGKVGWEQSVSVRRVEVENMHVAPFDSQLEHFVKVCRGEAKSSCSGEEGLRALVVCEAIRKALDVSGGGATVNIEEMESELNGIH